MKRTTSVIPMRTQNCNGVMQLMGVNFNNNSAIIQACRSIGRKELWKQH